jgi:hypothetical protein
MMAGGVKDVRIVVAKIWPNSTAKKHVTLSCSQNWSEKQKLLLDATVALTG